MDHSKTTRKDVPFKTMILIGAAAGAVAGVTLGTCAFSAWMFLEMLFLWDDTGQTPQWYPSGIYGPGGLATSILLAGSIVGGALAGARIAWRVFCRSVDPGRS